MSTGWKRIWLLWLCGVVAAAEFGKFTSLLLPLRHAYGLSLPEAGWLSSTIEIGGATLGLVIGALAGRIGARGAIWLGLGLLFAGAAGEGMAGAVGLWAGRVMESLGYLLVVVAAPTMIAGLAGEADRPRAIGLWSTFVPVGLAIGAAGSSLALPAAGLTGTLLLWAGLPLCLLALSLTLPRRAGGAAGAISFRMPGLSVWILCASFGSFAILFVGTLSMLPSFLAARHHVQPVLAGAVASLAALASILGSAVASFFAGRGGVERSRVLLVLELAGNIVPAVLIAWVFSARVPETAPWTIFAAAIVALAVYGIVPSISFMRLADTSSDNSGDALAIKNGLLTHFGASGSLVGPPLMAWLADGAGWPAIAPLAIGLCALTLGLSRMNVWLGRRA